MISFLALIAAASAAAIHSETFYLSALPHAGTNAVANAGFQLLTVENGQVVTTDDENAAKLVGFIDQDLHLALLNSQNHLSVDFEGKLVISNSTNGAFSVARDNLLYTHSEYVLEANWTVCNSQIYVGHHECESPVTVLLKTYGLNNDGIPDFPLL